MLTSYEWPGNVRELENVIQRCVALSSHSDVGTDTLPPEIRTVGDNSRQLFPLSVGPEGADLDKLVGHYERTLLGSALQMAGGNKTEAARLLGITFRSLRHRVQKLGLDEPSGDK